MPELETFQDIPGCPGVFLDPGQVIIRVWDILGYPRMSRVSLGLFGPGTSNCQSFRHPGYSQDYLDLGQATTAIVEFIATS